MVACLALRVLRIPSDMNCACESSKQLGVCAARAAHPSKPEPVVAVDGDVVTLHYDCTDMDGEVMCSCLLFFPVPAGSYVLQLVLTALTYQHSLLDLSNTTLSIQRSRRGERLSCV